MRASTLALLPILLGAPCLADSPARWIAEPCLAYAEGEGGSVSPGVSPAEAADARWNDAYRRGWRAIERGELTVAEAEMCRALLVARAFGPRDWRFAETLDELGLILFELRDFDAAERVQGAAIAEMLLAVGPRGEPLGEQGASSHAAIRPDCLSGIRVYTTRLGWIHEQTPGRVDTAELRREPWRIFAAGYLPLDAALAHRLDWLVSQYLLEENLAAADTLAELQRSILGDQR
jgi:hypothetical protein